MPLSTHTLASVSRAIGQREGRRIVGRAKLSDEDVKSACVFEDAVAVGTYHLDYHWTDTEKRAGTGVTDMVEPYHIPLRAMRPVGLDNVLCPGRSLSGDQLALSSYRAMATCAQMGLGAGTAAAQAVERRRSLDELDLDELKQDLSNAGQSLDLSDYGDYLRCLRVIDQPVPLPSRSGANSTSQLALSRLANGKTLAVRYERDNGNISAALRSRTRWHSAASLETLGQADLCSVVLRDDGRLAVGLELPDGARVEHVSPNPLHSHNKDHAPTGRVAAYRDLLGQREAPLSQPLFRLVLGPEGFPLLIERIPEPFEPSPASFELYGRAVSRCCSGTKTVWLVPFTGPASSGRTLLLALLAAKAGSPIERYRIVARDADPLTRPAIIATATGIALIYDQGDGITRFFEGSLERFSPVGAPPPREEDLQAMPYADHIIFSA